MRLGKGTAPANRLMRMIAVPARTIYADNVPGSKALSPSEGQSKLGKRWQIYIEALPP